MRQFREKVQIAFIKICKIYSKEELNLNDFGFFFIKIETVAALNRQKCDFVAPYALT